MNRKKTLVLVLVAVGLFAFLLLVAGSVTGYLVWRSLEQKRELSTPPSVFVHSPADGETLQTGNTTLAHVTASGVNPISRIEMWLDGELVETQTPDSVFASRTINSNAVFELSMTEGSHLVFWRAVDNTNLVGQSVPITLFSQPAISGETIVITSEEGQTLKDIADDQGADMGAVAQLNPDLGGKPLPGGSNVNVPAPPPPGGQPPPPPDGAPPTPPALPAPPGVEVLSPIAIPIIDIGSLITAILTNIPKAPSNLEAGFENCTIRLTWIDNADNETHFKVWMQRLGGPPQLIATLQGSPATGPAWYEFKSPAVGIYSFWVEAVNGLGGQPSEIKGVGVNDLNCKEAIATRLEIEALDMHISGGSDKVYCYLSLEGTTAQRIPDGNQFIAVLNQWGDITKYWGGEKRILLPIPADGQVSLEGECLEFGWQIPVSLGRFQASVPKEQWDGRRLEVKSNGFTVGYRILPHGDTQAQGLFFYTDYSIPQPYDVVVSQEKPDDPNDIVENVKLARRAFITWKWDGDETQIDNFVIYLDGKLLQWAQSDWRKTRLLLPTGCGQTYQLQVAANSGDALSVPSSPYTYVTPPCPVMAEVHFQTITASQTNDRSCYLINMVDCAPHGPCDQLSVYGEFWASSADYEVRYIGTKNFHKHFTCNVDYSFKMLSDGEDTLVIPIDPLNPNLRFGTIFHESDWFRDDNFGRVDQEIPPMSREQWSTYDQTFTFNPPDPDNTAKVHIKIRVKGFYFSE